MSRFLSGARGGDPRRVGRVIREISGTVVWEGPAAEAEEVALRLNSLTEDWQSFRSEELDELGRWHHRPIRGLSAG